MIYLTFQREDLALGGKELQYFRKMRNRLNIFCLSSLWIVVNRSN